MVKSKKIYGIEAQIVSLLRGGKKMSASSMARTLGMSENSINVGIHFIRKNVLLPDEAIVRSGKNGNSKYELVTTSTLETDKIERFSSGVINMRRMTRELIKLALISRATSNPQDIASLNLMIVNMMTDLSREISQMTMLQMPMANI